MIPGVTVDVAELIALASKAHNLLASKFKKSTHLAGVYQSRAQGRGMDFAEARHYQAGDDIKHMEWRVTARTGKPHIKIYHEEREIPVLILVDFNASMYFGTRLMFKSVLAAHLAAMLAWTARSIGDRIGGLLSSSHGHHEWLPRGRDLGVLPFLAGLSQYTQQLSALNPPRSSLLQALTRLNYIAKPGSVVIVISDFYNLTPECEHILKCLSAKHNMFAYHICDPLELHAPAPQYYPVTDGENNFLWNTNNIDARLGYQEQINHKLKHLQDFFLRHKIVYTLVSADEDLSNVVARTFCRRHRG